MLFASSDPRNLVLSRPWRDIREGMHASHMDFTGAQYAVEVR